MAAVTEVWALNLRVWPSSCLSLCRLLCRLLCPLYFGAPRLCGKCLIYRSLAGHSAAYRGWLESNVALFVLQVPEPRSCNARCKPLGRYTTVCRRCQAAGGRESKKNPAQAAGHFVAAKHRNIQVCQTRVDTSSRPKLAGRVRHRTRHMSPTSSAISAVHRPQQFAGVAVLAGRPPPEQFMRRADPADPTPAPTRPTCTHAPTLRC